MTTSADPRPRTGFRRLAFVLTTAIAALLLSGSPAIAAESPAALTIRPAGDSAPFFQLAGVPGTGQDISVSLENHGKEPMRARTYAADVYTAINGGFAARLHGEPTSGPTQWLAQSEEVIDIPAGTSITRTVRLTVPVDATPGEHMTSLVVENADPTKGSGNVAINQVTRSAVAVLITVPGPASAQLAVGDGPARYVTAGGHSAVRVDATNPGGLRLKPSAQLVVRDAQGSEVGRETLQMDTFYAGTSATVEFTLKASLPAGHYTVALTLEDAKAGVRVDRGDIPLEIPEAAKPTGEAPGTESAAAGGAEPTVPTAGPSAPLLVVIGVTLLLIGAGLGLVLRRPPKAERRRRHLIAD